MIFRTRPRRAARFAISLLLFALAFAPFQRVFALGITDEPQRDQLLNGLRVMMLPRSVDANVLIKLRINSGAAFDLAGKTGLMTLLGDMLFPDPETRSFFVEDLGGKLDVATDMDSIEITMTGHSAEFERMIELLRTAVVSTPITAENLNRLRGERLKIMQELAVVPATLADESIGVRLFREFPYGRPVAGTPETLARIDRADLLLARERFLTPDNATLVVIGGVEERRAMRALRQLLGTWRKSDKLVPSTFRQPDPPDTRILLVDMAGVETSDVRIACRGLARSDRDVAAVSLLALVAAEKWKAALPQLERSQFFVRHDAHILPGAFVMGASVKAADSGAVFDTARTVLSGLAQAPIPAADVDRVKAEALKTLRLQGDQPATLARLWLDVETYRLPSLSDQLNALGSVTAADIQRVAAKLFAGGAFASIAVGSTSIIKPILDRDGRKIEIPGNLLAQPSTTPMPAKP